MKVKWFSVLVLLASVNLSMAQLKGYEAGYVVFNNDTLRGFIERTGEASLSRAVNFKMDLHAEKKTFYPEDITGFGFTESALIFEPVQVEVGRDQVTRDSRFAKLMSRGGLSLYYLELEDNEIERILLNNNLHVFIVKRLNEGQNEFYTLSQYEYRQGKHVRTQKRYIGMLRFLLEDYLVKTKDDLYHLEFDEKALLELINAYNDFKSPGTKTTVFSYKVPAVVKRGIELSFGKMITSGHNIGSVMRPGDTRALNSKGYAIGYLWDVFKPNISKRMSSCLGVSYLYLNYKYQDASNTMVGITKHSLNIPILAQVNLGEFITDKTLFFLNGGPVFDLGTNNRFNRFHVKPYIGLGVGVYHHRFRYFLSLDNSSFLLKDDKYLRFSISFTQKRRKS